MRPHVLKLRNNDLVIVERWKRWVMMILLRTFLGYRSFLGFLDAVSRLREATKGVVLLTSYFQMIHQIWNLLKSDWWNEIWCELFQPSRNLFFYKFLVVASAPSSLFFFDRSNFGGWVLPWIIASLIESCADLSKTWVRYVFKFIFFTSPIYYRTRSFIDLKNLAVRQAPSLFVVHLDSSELLRVGLPPLIPTSPHLPRLWPSPHPNDAAGVTTYFVIRQFIF